jgi:hypothetical protein
MSRVSDVDTVAPDDNTPTAKVSATTPKPKPKSNTILTKASSDPSLPDTAMTQKVYDILGHTRHSLSSLLIKPQVFNFQEKDSDEEILLVARQHWINNVGWIVVTLLMLFVPTFLKIVPLLSSFAPAYQFMAILFWYLITFAYSFEKFLSWYFNVYIITTRRIVDIDFNNLLVKRYSDAEIGMIQDVTSEVIGVIPTIFNYGNILIQTASEVNQLVFERIPNPEKIIKLLQELRDEERINNRGGIN